MRDQDKSRAYRQARPWGRQDEQTWITEHYGPGWKPVPFGMTYSSFDWGPIHVAMRNVAQKTNAITGTTDLRQMAIEDCVLPIRINFPVPLRDRARNPRGFDHHWQKLTFALHPPDPRYFPKLQLNSKDAEALTRYVQICEELAEFTAFNEGGGTLRVDKDGPGQLDWSVTADLPSRESFTGLSTTFRQLHNDEEKASFTIVKGIMNKAANRLGSDQAADARKLLKAWGKGRAALNDRMLDTLVCEAAMGKRGPGDPQYSFAGVVPASLIKDFNYGDTLHWGARREQLAKLKENKNWESFNKHCVLASMLALSHFYFGFSVAARTALG